VKKKDRKNLEGFAKEELIVDLEEALFSIMIAARNPQGLTTTGVTFERATEIFERFKYLLINGPSKIHYIEDK
jgi:hypothetical protein